MRRPPWFLLPCLCLAALGWVTPAGPARADQDLNCEAYATKSVQQEKENRVRACGFAGAAWSLDAEGHRAWCLLPVVKMADLTHEDGARESALALCREKDAACGQYAGLALEQNRENIERGCGLAGARWSDDAAGHRAWCMTAAYEQIQGETTARHVALEACAGDSSLANIDLQNMLQRQQQILELLSNITETMHDSRMGVIRSTK